MWRPLAPNGKWLSCPLPTPLQIGTRARDESRSQHEPEIRPAEPESAYEQSAAPSRQHMGCAIAECDRVRPMHPTARGSRHAAATTVRPAALLAHHRQRALPARTAPTLRTDQRRTRIEDGKRLL